MAEETQSTSVPVRAAQGLLRSKSLWLALLITFAGAGWWAYSAISTVSSPPPPVGAASSFSGAVPNQTRAAPAPPAAFRYGASFVAAFFIAYVLKKVIRSVLLIAALIVGAILTLRYFGFLNYDWDTAQKQVEQGVGFAREEGEKYRTLVMSYLPSGLAAGAGALFGARRG